MKRSIENRKKTSGGGCAGRRGRRLSGSVCPVLVALMLVIGNIGAQIQPVLASTDANSAPTCGKEEHAHSADCYDGDGNLTCVKEEHAHNEACYVGVEKTEAAESGSAATGGDEAQATASEGSQGSESASSFSERTAVSNEEATPAESEEQWADGTVAVIDNVEYGTITDAINKVQAGETIRLVQDAEESVKVTGSGKNFTIDLDGHTWTGTTKTYAFQITAGTAKTEITLKSSEDGGTMKAGDAGRIIYMTQSSGKKGVTLVANGLTLEGSDTELSSDYYGGIVSVSGNASCATSSDGRMGVMLQSCTLKDGKAKRGGGALYLSNGDVTASECTFQNNMITTGSYTDCRGGAICVMNSGITNADWQSCATVKNTIFDSNVATKSGGAIYAQDSAMTVENSRFRNNKATQKDGGAICLEILTGGLGGLNVSGEDNNKTTFEENSAGYSGGAIYVYNQTSVSNDMKIVEADFVDNCAATSTTAAGEYGGGAISFGYNSKTVTSSRPDDDLTLENVTMKSNKVANAGSGGAIQVLTQGTLDISSSIITENEAEGDGGGICAHGLAKVQVTNSTIANNTAGSNGGGVYYYGKFHTGSKGIKGYATFEGNTTVTGNAAKEAGGGLYLGSWYKKKNGTNYYSKNTYTLGTDVHVYNNHIESGTAGDSSEIYVQYPSSYAPTMVGFAQTYTDEDETTYTMTKDAASKSGTAYYYYSKVKKAGRVYLDVTGSDHGHDDDEVYNTLANAAKAVEDKPSEKKTIYVCGTVSLTEDDETYLNEKGITFVRCDNNTEALFRIPTGGDITLKGAKIDGASCEAQAALVKVASGAILNVDEDTVLQKNNNATGNGGGIYVEPNGKVNVLGGSIQNNVAAKDGGGIYLATYTQLTMSGGTVDGNVAKEGGGIYGYFATLNITGGTISNNNANGGDGGGGIGTLGGTLKIIKDGNKKAAIVNNVATWFGGGISMWGESKATIEYAKIIGNKQTKDTMLAGGGGIYVNEGCTLHMKNLYVSNNKSGVGNPEGALYICPTGKLAIFKINGALIADNKDYNGSRGQDIYFWHTGGNTVAYVSDYVLGMRTETDSDAVDAAPANWSKDANGEEPYDTLYGKTETFSAYSQADDSVKAAAREIAAEDGVVMTGNSSTQPGSAIANNGSLTVGTEETAVTVEKKWILGEGETTPDEAIACLKGSVGDVEGIYTATLNEGNDWSHTWENLNASVDWEVTEASMKGYECAMVTEADATWPDVITKHTIVTITNTASEEAKQDLTVTKKVESERGDTSGEFPFTMTLDFTQAKGGAANGAYVYRIAETKMDATAAEAVEWEPLDRLIQGESEDGNKKTIAFKLGHGQTLTIRALPAGMTYDVEETKVDAYVVTTKTNDDKATVATEAEGTIPNEANAEDEKILFQNYPKSEAKIVKTLRNYNQTLGGAMFAFKVTATWEGKTLYSDVLAVEFSEAGTKEIDIGSFPAGTKVTVEETYSGSCYELADSEKTQILTIDGSEDEFAATYVNDYDEGLNPGTGAVNHFDNNGNGGWSWTKQ